MDPHVFRWASLSAALFWRVYFCRRPSEHPALDGILLGDRYDSGQRQRRHEPPVRSERRTRIVQSDVVHRKPDDDADEALTRDLNTRPGGRHKGCYDEILRRGGVKTHQVNGDGQERRYVRLADLGASALLKATLPDSRPMPSKRENAEYHIARLELLVPTCRPEE